MTIVGISQYQLKPYMFIYILLRDYLFIKYSFADRNTNTNAASGADEGGKDYTWLILAIVAGLILLAVIIIIIVVLKRKRNEKKKENYIEQVSLKKWFLHLRSYLICLKF